MGDSIKQEELEYSRELLELKDFLSDEFQDIGREIDDEDKEKIRNLTNELKEKYFKNPTIEKKVDDAKSSFYQKFKHSLENDIDIDPGRLLSLTDGIFGMVMTLLVFAMALPEAQLLTEGDFLAFLHSIAPTFGFTVVSFILVSSFWIYHHEFIKINSLNIPYLWFNIMFLGSISFIPFSTSIIGTYSQFFFAEVLFGLNIFFALLFFSIMYRYAYKKGFLENNPSESENKYVFNTMVIIMGLTVVVNLLDFHISSDFIYLFLLVPVISTLRDINFRMKS